MCGICGFTTPPNPQLLERMTATLAHRGPDGSGTYQAPSGRVSLGHRRLSIIDIAGGSQPMLTEDGLLCISFNGEIYNYQELREGLRARGINLRTCSDTETLLHLYREHGVEMLGQLNGMFAFAIWDDLRQRLFLARDRMGVKPLYWASTGKGIVFASEMKAVLCHPGIDTTISPRSVSLYLSLRNVPGPGTIFQGINTLPPAHFMLVEPDREPSIVRYWSLDFSHPGNDSREEQYVDELEALLLDATKLRMRADVPVGAYLSGGVDSSLTVALVRKFHAGTFHTFSLAYADKPKDKNDAYFARIVAEQYGTEHHEYVMDAAELTAELDTLAHFLEQPFAGVNSTYFLTRLVKQHVKVVLSGDGADDQFASYGHHRLVWPLERLAEARRRGQTDPYAGTDLSPLAGQKHYVQQFDGLDPIGLRASFGAFPDTEKVQVLHADYRAWVEEHSIRGFYEGYWQAATARDALNRMLEVDIQTLLPNEILVFCDRLSMAHSVEARSPFLDYRVAELGACIPGSLKIKGATLKHILKRVAARHLSPEIIQRPKEGFVLPKHVWLRGHLDTLLHDILSPSSLAKHGYFDAGRVTELVRQHKSGEMDHSFRIWSIIMFQTWYDTVYCRLDSQP